MVEDSISAKTITSTSCLSNLAISKTALDKFFKDLQHESEKKRWSAECLLSETSKRIFGKLGVTSNFTRHARECHKQAFDIWLRELNETKAISPMTTNKIHKSFCTNKPCATAFNKYSKSFSTSRVIKEYRRRFNY